jgi:hypothetical protein
MDIEATETTPAEGTEGATARRPRPCAGCAERDAKVRQLGDDLVDELASMERRVFTVAGVALGVALGAVVIAFWALASGRVGRRGEAPEWDE